MRGSAVFRTGVAPGGALAGPWVQNELWTRARAVPSLDLRFADNKSLVDATTGAQLDTFTRASSGTFVGSDGLLMTAATNEPRFDHNPTTGESLGLLVEESRTNYATQSETFTGWAPNQVTLSSASASAPNGASTVYQIIEDTSTSTHRIFVSPTTGQTVQSHSLFVKLASGTRRVYLSSDDTTGARQSITFNLQTGTLVAAGASWSNVFITPYPNGWYRIGGTITDNGGSTIFMCGLDNGSVSSYAGDGTSGIYIWGAQLEAGAFPTSYIPTTTAAATRAADVASITGTNFSSWYSQSEGTVFASSSSYGASNTNRRIAFATDGTISNRFGLLYNNVNTPQMVVASAGTVVASQSAVLTGANYSIAAAYKLDDYAISAAGSSPSTDTAGALPVGINQLGIGNQLNGEHINGTIRRLTYWPVRLGNTVLQQITQ